MGESLHGHSEGSALKNFFTAGNSPADNWTEGSLQIIALVLCCHQLQELLTCDACSVVWECSATWSKCGRLSAQLWCLSLTFNIVLGSTLQRKTQSRDQSGLYNGTRRYSREKNGVSRDAILGVLA